MSPSARAMAMSVGRAMSSEEEAPALGDGDHPHSESFILRNFETVEVGKAKSRRFGYQGTCDVIVKSARRMRPSKVFPILGWLPQLLRQNPLRCMLRDAICGVTVAAVVVPQGMAYGMLAGLPPVYGLYTAVLPSLAYTVFGSCMHLAVGPFALISMLTAQGIQSAVPDAGADPGAAVAAAGVLALLVGLVLLALGILRLGFIATFLSDPVLSGYTTAVSIVIPTSQLRLAFQVDVPRGSFIQTVLGLVREVSKGHTNFASLAVFTVSLACILFIQRLNACPRFPVLKKFPLPAELLVVILSTLVCGMCGLSDEPGAGIHVLGEIPKGLPRLALPEVDRFDLSELMSSVLIIALMTYITAMSVSKTFGRKFGYEVDNNQELIALGMANLVGSLSSSFPAAASLSRTAIAGASGAATPLHNAWTVAILVLVLLFCSPLLATLPSAALAAIVVAAFKSLLLNGVAEMRMSWRVSPSDFLLWNIAFWSTLSTGVTMGIIIAVSANLVFLFWKSTRPSSAVLGRLEGTRRLYRNRKYFTQAQAVDGLMIFRFDASLHFANREVFATDLWHELRAHDAEMNGQGVEEGMSFWDGICALGGALVSCTSENPNPEQVDRRRVKAVVVDFSPVCHIDISAIRMIEKLRGELSSRGTRLVFAHCKYEIHRKLTDMGIFDSFEDTSEFDVVCFRELHDAVVFAEGRIPVPVMPRLVSESEVSQVSGHSTISASVPASLNPNMTPGCPGRKCRRMSTSELLEECGIAVGHDDVGHHEPTYVARQGGHSLFQGKGAFDFEGTFEVQVSEPANGLAKDLEAGVTIRRSLSEGCMGQASEPARL